MSGTQVNKRVKKHRDSKRDAGLRPVQIWVPDTRRPDFDQECRRQTLLVRASDLADPDLARFIESTVNKIDGWTP